MNNRKTRVVLAATLTTMLVAAFAALGGVSVAQSAISAVQYQYGHKVTICHKGKVTIKVAKAAVPAHVKHGDTVGTCAQAKAKKAKAAKAKAAKIKAAKAKAAKAKAPKVEQTAAPETEKPGKGKGRGK